MLSLLRGEPAVRGIRSRSHFCRSYGILSLGLGYTVARLFYIGRHIYCNIFVGITIRPLHVFA